MMPPLLLIRCYGCRFATYAILPYMFIDADYLMLFPPYAIFASLFVAAFSLLVIR